MSDHVKNVACSSGRLIGSTTTRLLQASRHPNRWRNCPGACQGRHQDTPRHAQTHTHIPSAAIVFFERVTAVWSMRSAEMPISQPWCCQTLVCADKAQVFSRSNAHQVLRHSLGLGQKRGAKIGKRDGGMASALLQSKILYWHSLIKWHCSYVFQQYWQPDRQTWRVIYRESTVHVAQNASACKIPGADLGPQCPTWCCWNNYSASNRSVHQMGLEIESEYCKGLLAPMEQNFHITLNFRKLAINCYPLIQQWSQIGLRRLKICNLGHGIVSNNNILTAWPEIRQMWWWMMMVQMDKNGMLGWMF